MNLIELTINSLKFDRVTVYQNEAEVTRLLRVHLTPGLSNIKINSVPDYIDTDSIQIFSCCELDIVDVKMSKKALFDDDDGIHKLKSEMTNLELEYQHLKTKLDTATSKMDNLNNFFNNLTKQPTLNSLIPFFDCYSVKIDSLTKEKIELESELKSLEHNLRLKREEYESRLKEFNLVSIHVQVSTTIDTDVNIYLSYIVQNVSWTPKYEIRADLVTNNMTLYYYGIVSQSTGEDWKNTMITLSTAQPNIQPSAPCLETQKVRSCPVPLIEQTRRASYMSSSSQLSIPSLAIRRASEMFTPERPEIKEPIFESFIDQTINLVACYDIKEQTCVAKNGQPSQVLIAKFDLNAEFLHEACPSKDRNVYITARARNTSDFLLLPGTASIYLNKNFWSKTNFKSQFPGEEFICPLGVDRSIVLGFKSEKILSNQTGVVNKNKSNIYTKIIEMKNNSFKQAKILLKENLPLSTDEKVQVKLLEPILSKSLTNVRLNKMNNLEFDIIVGSYDTQSVRIKYKIESPIDFDVEFF